MSRSGHEATPWRRGPVIAVLALFFVVSPGSAQDQLILRNNDVISGAIVKFDEDGIHVQGQSRTFTWDEVHKGTASIDQAGFDKLLRELGEPLFRVRRRASDGDYRDVLDQARKLFPVYASRRSPSAFLVAHALARSCLENGRREEAVAPYLVYADLLAAREHTGAAKFEVKIRVEGNWLTRALPPVWFDSVAAKSALETLDKVIPTLRQNPLPQGVHVYRATLALAAGVDASAHLKQIDTTNPAMRELLSILDAQKEVEAGKPGAAVAALETSVGNLRVENKALAHYWLGRAGLLSKDLKRRKEGIVWLLHLPALQKDQAPDLAAAGLYLSAQALAELPDASAHVQAIQRLRNEVLNRYAGTWYGVKLKMDLQSKP